MSQSESPFFFPDKDTRNYFKIITSPAYNRIIMLEVEKTGIIQLDSFQRHTRGKYYSPGLVVLKHLKVP